MPCTSADVHLIQECSQQLSRSQHSEMLFADAVLAGLSCLGAQVVLSAFFAYALPSGPWKTQPGFTAHRVLSFLTMAYVSRLGLQAWFFPDAEMISASSTTLSRLEQAHPVGMHLSQVLLGLNVIWDIPMGFLIDSLRTRSNARLMLLHHLVVVVLTWLTIEPARFHYYCIFFFGAAEISTVPLALMDLFHPRNEDWSRLAKRSAAVGAFNSVCRVVFALAYLLTRAAYFPYVMFTGVVPDLLELLAMPARPVSKASLHIILWSGIGLTGLQLYWAGLLVQQATAGRGATKPSKKL